MSVVRLKAMYGWRRRRYEVRREENNLQQSVLQECESMRRAESSSIFEFMKSHRMLLSTVSRETGARRGGGRGSWEDRGREAVKRARGEERKGCMGRHLTSSSLLSSSSAVARLRWLDPLALRGEFGIAGEGEASCTRGTRHGARGASGAGST